MLTLWKEIQEKGRRWLDSANITSIESSYGYIANSLSIGGLVYIVTFVERMYLSTKVIISCLKMKYGI